MRFLASLIAVVWAGMALAETPVTIGVLSYRGSEAAQTEFAPSAAQLGAALPGHEIRVVPLSLADLDEAARNGAVDFVFTNPGNSYQMVRRHGASRLATARYPALGDHQRVIGAVIVTRADGPVQHLSDLPGLRMGIVDEAAFGGNLLAQQRLSRDLGRAAAGIETVELGFPQQRVLDAVRSGTVGAGVVRACLLETLEAEGRLRAGTFRALAPVAEPSVPCVTSTALHPGWAFLMLPHVSPELATRATRALLSMPAEGAAGLLETDGWLVPIGYASVEEVYRELELYPFARDFGASLRAWLRDNVLWVAFAAILAGMFLLHVARVEYLVVRRTQALEHEAAQRRALEAEMAHTDRLSSMALLAGSLAHDLNQPLAAIASFANGLRQRRRAGTDDPEATDRVLVRIVEQANRGADFIRSMRSFLSRGAPVEERLDLREVIDDAILLTSGHARKSALDLDWRRPPAPADVLGDPVRLRQVVVALVQNAMEASQPGQAITVDLGEQDDRWRLRVIDAGSDLDAEARERATEAFFTTKGAGGLGLGLSTALAIVEERGGRLHLESRPPGGTIAIVELPMEPQR